MSNTTLKIRQLPKPSVDGLDRSVGALYEELSGFLVSRVRARFGSGPPEPEDVIQTAFLKFYEHKDFRSIKDPKAYLLRAVNNVAISEIRALEVRARHAHHLADGRDTEKQGFALDVERVLTRRDLLDHISRVIDNLPEKQRRILEMNRFEDLSLTEIARREGISRTAVSKHLARALAAVDKYLEHHQS